MRHQIASLRDRVRRPGPLAAISLAYIVVCSGIMIWQGISVSPDYILVLLVPLALLAGKLSRYLKDWVPFVAVFLGWEAMRGIAPRLHTPVHVSDLAGLEQTLFFGHLPSVVLQSLTPVGPLRSGAALVATVIYFCHFIFPLGVGFLLWQAERTQFLRYTSAMMGMCFAAFVVFLLAPTAPPWYAQDQGVICCVTKLISSTLPSEISPYYETLNPNQVAAFPSLHAAFPFLTFLALRGRFPRAAWLALGWCFLVWVSVVYLGEHYAVDVIAGVALAAASWTVLMRYIVPRLGWLQRAPVETALVPQRSAA